MADMEKLKTKQEFLLSQAPDMGDPRNDKIIPTLDDNPVEHTTTLHQAIKSYRIRKETNQAINEELKTLRGEGVRSTFGQDVAAGVGRVGESLYELPFKVSNLATRIFDGHFFPDATQKEALQLAESTTNWLRANKEAREALEVRTGTADSITANLASGATQVILYGLVGLGTGGVGVGALAGIQEAGEASEDWAVDYQNKNEGSLEGFNNVTSSIAAVAHGAVSGYIENELGVEKLFRPAISANLAKRVGRHFVAGATGEGLEEYFQEISRWGFGKVAGHEDRSLFDMNKDAAVNAIYGAVLGGAFGSGLYYVNRSRLKNNLIQDGFTPDEAGQIADKIIDTGKEALFNEIAVRDQLTQAYGKEYNNLVDKIETVLRNAQAEGLPQGEELRKYANNAATDIGMQAIRIAKLQSVPVKEVLDISEIKVNPEGNILYLETPNVNDPKALNEQVKQKKARIKELNKQIGIDNKAIKAELRNQIKVLQARIDTLGFNDKVTAQRNNATKAKMDQNVIASTRPEIIQDLAGIRQANVNEDFVYVGNSRVPVNYTVMSLSEVQGSHVKGEPNPKYTFKELQNRTRGTVVDEAILQNRAANFKAEEVLNSPNTQYGAPIINQNSEVISGNGRLEVIRKAYEMGRADKYVKLLNKMGYDTTGIENPVLVRRTSDNLDPAQQLAIAEASNVSETSAFDHARQSLNDSKLLTEGINSARDFADKLPITERQGYIRENGNYDMLALQRRFDDAVLAWILGGTKTFESIVMSNRLPQKVMTGLSQKGGVIVDFANRYPEVGLKEDLRQAMLKAATMKTKADYVDTIQQIDIEQGDTFSSDALLYAMTFSNNSSQLGQFIDAYTSRHGGYIEDNKNNFLADALPQFSKNDLTGQVIRDSQITAGKWNSDNTTNDVNLRALFLNQIPVEFEGEGTTNINTLFQTSVDERNLVTQHATTLDKLQEALELGAMPMPSLAVTKAEYAGSGRFGEIIFIGGSNVIDPNMNIANRVFQADIYSTRKVNPTFEINKDGAEYIQRQTGNISKKGNNYWISNIAYDLERGSDNSLKELYLASIGKIKDLDGGTYQIVQSMTDKEKSDFSKWKRKFISEYTDKKIFEGFTPSGNRKFSPYDLKNVLRVMQKENLKGSENTAGGNAHALRGIWAEEFKSIEDIRKSKGKIVDEQTYDKMDNIIWDETTKLSDLLVSEKKAEELEQSFVGPDEYMIDEALKLIKPSSNIAKILEKADLRADKKAVDAVKRYMKIVKDLPVQYFEAKPQRAVDFSEFEGVIMPTSSEYNDVAERMKEYGLRVIRSDDARLNISDFSNIYYQNANGFFDTELKAIVIGSNANAGTLPHEMAHFWLDKLFNIWKKGNANPAFMQDFNRLAEILNISPEQDFLTRNQQEQFASMTEGYIFNRAAFPEGSEPIMKLYIDWLPPQYNSMADIGFRKEDGTIYNPIFDQKSKEYFDNLYSAVAGLGRFPMTVAFDNPDDKNGDKLKATQEQVKERNAVIDKEATERLKEELANQTQDVIDASFKIQAKEDPTVEAVYSEAIEAETARPKTVAERFKNYVTPGRGTNTRAEQDARAQEFIAKDNDKANEIAFGNPINSEADYVENTSGVDRSVLIINVMKNYDMKSPEYASLYHNLALTRSLSGKTGGLTNDLSQRFYLKAYGQIVNSMEQRAAVVKYGKTKRAVEYWNRDIDRFIQSQMDSVLKTAPESEERDAAINRMLQNARQEFGEDAQIQLLQEDLNRVRRAKKGDKKIFEDWARKEIKKMAKGAPTAEEISQLMTLSIEAQKAATEIDSNDKAKAVAASLAIRRWQDFVSSKGMPQSFLQKIIGQYAPRAMLSGPSTHAVNIVGNTFSQATVKAAMRLHYGSNIVSDSAIKAEKDRLWGIYERTGQNFAQNLNVDDVSKIHGEQYTLSTEQGLIENLDPFRWLGREDFYFRVNSYLDALARIASRDAKGDASKANELFNEYKKLNSTSAEARDARIEALTVGNIVVFQQDGTLAKVVSNLRNALDLINLEAPGQSGYKGLGTLIAPFAKTPANIVGMGLDAIAAPFKRLGYAVGLKKNWTINDSIALANSGAAVALITAMIAGACEYEPPYNPPAQYDPNTPYDSIKLGGVWLGLDTFGVLATPIRMALMLVGGDYNGKRGAAGVVGETIGEVIGDIPLAGDVTDEIKYITKNPADYLAGAAYNQINKLFPAIARTPTKILMRQTGLRVDSKNRIARKFARAYGLDGSETSINDYVRFLYNRATIDESLMK